MATLAIAVLAGYSRKARLLPDGGKRRRSFTGIAGANHALDRSFSLSPPNWIPLVTNPLTLGSLTFTDVLATNYPRRFYRATLQP